jgi:hypothetical protein
MREALASSETLAFICTAGENFARLPINTIPAAHRATMLFGDTAIRPECQVNFWLENSQPG